MRSFSKIFTLGHRAIADIWDYKIEISEKIDGSQFRFFKDADGVIHTFSKGNEIFHPTNDNLFKPGVEYINLIQNRIPKSFNIYSETLYRPKHNVIKYDSVPKNHIALFGVYDLINENFLSHKEMTNFANDLEVDVVPLLYEGTLPKDRRPGWTTEFVKALLERDSYLGGHKIEGVVVRSIEKAVNFKGIIFPMAIGKFVSEQFKEKQGRKPKKKNQWTDYIEQYRTEARWQKAYQHLREAGKIEHEPRDIGNIIKEAQRDITEECKDEIMEYLWKMYGGQLLRHSIKGLPEWYKEKLLTDLY
jgi:hypothetical protein